MKNLIPMFYYPLGIMFIDDDVEQLKAYHHLGLPNKIITEHDPNKAILQLICNESNSISPFNSHNKSFNDIDLKSDDKSIITFEFIFDELKNFIHNTAKYKHYKIIIADYDMPTINGIQLFEKLNDNSFIKILLTGKYKPLNAVAQLNHKTIDYFLQKGQSTTNAELIESIKTLEFKYFQAITCNFLDITQHKMSFLFDTAYIELFNSITKANNISEYYLINQTGCYLMQNPDKQYFLLNVYSDIDLSNFCDLYQNVLDHDTISQIKYRNIIPNCEQIKKLLQSNFINKNQFDKCLQHEKYYYNLVNL